MRRDAQQHRGNEQEERERRIGEAIADAAVGEGRGEAQRQLLEPVAVEQRLGVRVVPRHQHARGHIHEGVPIGGEREGLPQLPVPVRVREDHEREGRKDPARRAACIGMSPAAIKAPAKCQCTRASPTRPTFATRGSLPFITFVVLHGTQGRHACYRLRA